MTTAHEDSTEFRTPEETPTIRVDTAAAVQLTPGAILGGRYRIVSLLGRGGMGEVYRADDLRLGQPVALKFLARRRAENERLLHDEVRIGRQISHPNVCRLYDIAEVDDRVFITMEYVDGEDLASLLRRVGRLSPDKALSVARDLAGGVAAAHELGVIHRDLKPGNVMIDGRGRARITDFGLAVAEETREQTTSGTPAYMAPEQLAGEPSSVRSDLYALGLILYEVFTGRRVFGGASLSEIIRQQREQHFTPPRAIVPDLDPAIERAILRCLENDPNARPASVQELLRELPSYDPLAAAIAAGDTPSAGMVAASNRKGDLSSLVAWVMLAAALAGILGVAALGTRARVGTSTPTKPPDVLLERTRAILSAAGVTAPAHDSGFFYRVDQEHVDANRGRTTARTPIEFVYRQSPRPMRPRNTTYALLPEDPAFDRSGMARVRLDSTGRLHELAVVPPQRERATARAPFDWSPLFAFAGIDRATVRPVPSEWAAPADSDDKHAWMSGATRIEAASYHGLPVWFAVLEPWQAPSRMTPRRPRAEWTLSRRIEMVLLIVLPTVVFLLAWHNVRRGRGDRSGALRIAVFTFVMLWCSSLLYMHHPSSMEAEWMALSSVTAATAFWALPTWVGYLALEPFVRRRWPEMLISWSRLLGGNWRDPMIGRDLLIAAVGGTSLAIALLLLSIVPRWVGLESALISDSARALTSVRFVFSAFFFGAFECIFMSIFALVLLLLLRAMVQHTWIASVLAAGILAAYYQSAADGPLAFRIAFGMFAGALVYGVLLRFGLLACVLMGYTVLIVQNVPLTLDTSAWYFPRAALALILLAALASFGFYTSLAGKRFLPRVSL
ncbi:MAG TPA: serine/threonine-protein kinase [Thermoanaerobaculia bacterium]|nr:serine/threonine-protein kinase [Thermoanaerobaculia bacterium]